MRIAGRILLLGFLLGVLAADGLGYIHAYALSGSRFAAHDEWASIRMLTVHVERSAEFFAAARAHRASFRLPREAPRLPVIARASDPQEGGPDHTAATFHPKRPIPRASEVDPLLSV